MKLYLDITIYTDIIYKTYRSQIIYGDLVETVGPYFQLYTINTITFNYKNNINI